MYFRITALVLVFQVFNECTSTCDRHYVIFEGITDGDNITTLTPKSLSTIDWERFPSTIITKECSVELYNCNSSTPCTKYLHSPTERTKSDAAYAPEDTDDEASLPGDMDATIKEPITTLPSTNTEYTSDGHDISSSTSTFNYQTENNNGTRMKELILRKDAGRTTLIVAGATAGSLGVATVVYYVARKIQTSIQSNSYRMDP